MRIGLGHIEANNLDEVIANIKRVEEAGFDSVSVNNVFHFDALTVCALAGRETTTLELLTAVVPTFPRHPHSMAQQAMTTQAACKGRLSLGIGISHQVVIETILGLSYDKPVRHLREYLEVLVGLLETGSAEVNGEMYRVHANLQIDDTPKPDIIIGALRPQMVKLAGRMTEGTATWMCGPNYLRDSIAKPMNETAESCGRKRPRVCAGLPVCVTDQKNTAYQKINTEYAIYGSLPVYRACLDAEGADGPADISIIGDEAEVQDRVLALADYGVTDFAASIIPIGDDEDASFERGFACMADTAARA